jgi:hypothetical protein
MFLVNLIAFLLLHARQTLQWVRKTPPYRAKLNGKLQKSNEYSAKKCNNRKQLPYSPDISPFEAG